MKRGSLKSHIYIEFFKIFYVAAFLFISVFFVLPYLVQISTYFHEKSHQQMLDTYGVKNEYLFNLLETIPHFWDPRVDKLGITRFDLTEYKTLSPIQKAEINLAGVISDLKFLFLISIYLTFANVYTFYKIRYKKEYNLTGVLAVNWILFIWLLALIQITVANISYSQGDVYQLIMNIR